MEWLGSHVEKIVEVTEIGANPYTDESFKSNETSVLDNRNLERTLDRLSNARSVLYVVLTRNEGVVCAFALLSSLVTCEEGNSVVLSRLCYW